MSLNAGEIKNESNFKRPDPLEPGAYPGRLVWVIDLGVQEQDDYQGQEKPPRQMVYTTYELSDEFLLDDEGNELEDKPRFYSEDFPLHSLDSDKAKSTIRYTALDPKLEFGGNWPDVVGAPVIINLIQKKKQRDGSIYDRIGSTSTMRSKEADKLPNLVNEPKVFSFDDPDMEVFGSLPQWLQDKIKGALNFEGSKVEELLGSEPKTKKKEKVEKEQLEEPVAANDEEDW